MARLILDTAAVIAIERGVWDLAPWADDDLAIAAVTVAELRTGVEFAPGPELADRRARVVAAVTASIAVLDYTERTAAEHARLLAHTRRSGTPRGAHDLIIAAHAVQDGRAVLSPDARARFSELPGVRVAQAPVTR